MPTHRIHPLLLIVALLLTALIAPASAASRTAGGERTALDRYVKAPDTN